MKAIFLDVFSDRPIADFCTVLEPRCGGFHMLLQYFRGSWYLALNTFTTARFGRLVFGKEDNWMGYPNIS